MRKRNKMHCEEQKTRRRKVTMDMHENEYREVTRAGDLFCS